MVIGAIFAVLTVAGLVLVLQFPGTVVAGFFRFCRVEYFELDDAGERQVPPVGDLIP